MIGIYELIMLFSIFLCLFEPFVIKHISVKKNYYKDVTFTKFKWLIKIPVRLCLCGLDTVCLKYICDDIPKNI